MRRRLLPQRPRAGDSAAVRAAHTAAVPALPSPQSHRLPAPSARRLQAQRAREQELSAANSRRVNAEWVQRLRGAKLAELQAEASAAARQHDWEVDRKDRLIEVGAARGMACGQGLRGCGALLASADACAAHPGMMSRQAPFPLCWSHPNSSSTHLRWARA